MVGVEGRVRSVAVHGECLLGAVKRKREDGTKVDVDVDVDSDSEVEDMIYVLIYF